jgi:hypothetical protein
MAKRFTDTNKWKDSWYQDLPSKYKLFWNYILDECDNAGIWKPNLRLAQFQIGEPFEESEVRRIFADRINFTDKGYWFIPKFINFQYGDLSEACKPHIPVIKKLTEIGLDWKEFNTGEIGKTHNISKSTRSFVIARDGMCCTYCESKLSNFDIVLDHVIPRIKGGSDKSNNLVVSCKKCNSKKSDIGVIEFAKLNFTNAEDIIKRVSERVSHTLKEKEKEEEEESNVDKSLKNDTYLNGGDAWADITSDALFLERLVRIVRGTGATEENVLKATKYFLTLEDAKPNFDLRPRDEVKKHLVNWLNTQKKNVTTY